MHNPASIIENDTGTGRLRNQRTRRNHQDYSIKKKKKKFQYQ